MTPSGGPVPPPRFPEPKKPKLSADKPAVVSTPTTSGGAGKGSSLSGVTLSAPPTSHAAGMYSLTDIIYIYMESRVERVNRVSLDLSHFPSL